MDLNLDQARSIIAEASNHGAYDGPYPEDDDKAIEEASTLVEYAKAARSAGVKSDAVTSVLFIAESDLAPHIELNGDKESAVDPLAEQVARSSAERGNPALAQQVLAQEEEKEKSQVSSSATSAPSPFASRLAEEEAIAPEPPEPEPEGEVNEPSPLSSSTTDGSSEDSPSESSEPSPEIITTEEVKTRARKRGIIPTPVPDVIVEATQVVNSLMREGLPIPGELEGEPPVLPRDLTQVGDTEFRRLHSEFSAAYSRANFLATLAQADDYGTKQLMDKTYAKALLQAGAGDHKKTVPVIESEAKNSPEFLEVLDQYTKAHIQWKILREYAEGLQDTCDRLSREWSMRQDEWEKTRT